MNELELKVTLRDERGKGPARKLRRAGMVPAVVYSGGKCTAVCMSQREMMRMLSTSAGENVLFRLNISGDENKDRNVMVKDLQFDPVKGSLLHVDFYEVQMDKPVTINVPIALVGRAAKVEGQGGTVELILKELEVECLPANIPANIEFDISDLDVGDVLHVKDIKVPAGIKVLNDPNVVLLTVASARAEEVAPPPEVEQVEAAEEKPAEEEKA